MADRVISYEFRGKFANLTAGLTASSKAVGELGGNLTALDKQGAKMRAGLNNLGGAAGKVGLVAAVGLGAAIAVTAKFESAMSRVSAATNASASDLEALRKAAIKAGADTVFSASEAADGMTELAKAGLSAKDILGGGLSGALNLAAAGQISVSEAAETTAITLQQFALDGSQATRVADTLAAGASKAVGGVTDMAGALKYVGPVASQMGLSLEDAAGAVAELSSQGVIGESAGTALRGMLTSLTSPSKAAANQMDALGISMYDAQGKFVGIDGIAQQLKETMGGLTAAQRDEALGRIFGNEQITAARILYSGGAADVEKWTKAVTDSGFAAEQAAKLNDNLAGDIEQLKGSFETALIETGSGSQGPLRGLVQNLTDVVNGYSSLPGPAQSATSAALAVTAALGGGAFVFSKAIGGLANLQGSLQDMGVSAERATMLTRGLGKAAGAAAGLGLFAAGLASTNEELGSLEATAGGAIAGFSVGGPWGAAIGGAIGLVVSLGTSHKDTAKDVAALSASFDTQTGAITANTEAMVAKKLQDTGAFDSAERLGISTQLVTDAVLGQAGAQDQLNAALAGYMNTDLANIAYEQADGFTAAEVAAINNARAAQGLADTVPAMSGVFATAADKAKQLAGALGSGESGVAGATVDLQTAQAAGFQTGEEYAAAQKAAAKALQDAQDAAHDTATSFFNLGDSVNDAKVSLGDWIGSLEKQADALRNFRVNAKKAADEGLRKGLISALQEAGPEGAMRLQQLANASEEEIGRANKAWKRGQDEINRYTHAVGKVPASATTNVNANVNGAIAALNGIQNYKLRDKFITVHTRNTGNPKTGFASGGFTGRGGKYEPAGIVHRGEVVIPADRVKSDWSMLKARYGDLPGFASGGLVSRPLFTDEGPHFYKAAYRHNKPFAKSGPASWPSPYQTTLSAAEEALFEAWVSSAGVPFDPFSRLTDYDMRGFWKRTQGAGWAQGSHFPDTYKTPYDTTFSHESKYATANNPFFWHGNSLIDQRNGQVVFAADGATVPKTGRGYADRHLYMLADGEEVISNRYGQADRFRSDRANGRIPGYANGGTAGKRSRDVVNVTGFSDSARDMGIPELRGMRRELAETNRALNHSTAALDAQTDAVSRETSARDDLVSQMGSLASSIAGQFDSNLFEPLNDVWGSNRTTSDPISVLMGDLANSAQFSSLFAGLQGRGLSGGALTAAAQGGVAGLQAVGAYSDADLARYADLYAQREASRSNTGQQVAMAQFGQALADQQGLLDEANRQRTYLIAQNDQLIAAAHAQTGAVKSVEDATKDNGKATSSGRRSKVRKG